jgi:serine/threonine-protein kinase HipA
MNISRCPSCLKPGYTEFCNSCRKKLFGGQKVSPILPFSRPEYNHRRFEHGDRISISGVQSKYSLKLRGTILELTETGGEYILKPFVSGELENMSSMPANEHITMQMAKRIFGLDIAENALVFFRDDKTPAYLTKRFDVVGEGKKLQQEDFAQISQASEETNGRNYKYDFSYEKIAALMKEYVSAYSVEVEKFFRIIVFNYLVHNGDAHLKNFSLYRNPAMNAYTLTPAYDLLNTRMHLPTETALALDLFESDFETESYKVNGFYARDDFFEFGVRIQISQSRLNRFLDEMADREGDMCEMLDSSYLDDPLKARYKEMIKERISALKYSYKNATKKAS